MKAVISGCPGRVRLLSALALAGWLGACQAMPPTPSGTPTPDVVVMHTAAPPETPAATEVPVGVLPRPLVPVLGTPVMLDGPAGKCWQAALGVVADLAGITFVDADTGWAVGASGTILHTTDGGETWARQASPENADLQKVVFLDRLTGWIAGPDNLLLHTTDGGLTWRAIRLTAYRPGTDLVDIAAAGPTGLWALADARPFVLRTQDSGATWEEQVLPAYGAPVAITRVDRVHAWVATADTLLRTTNGGSSWVQAQVEGAMEFQGLSPLRGVAFVDRLNGWLVTSRAAVAHTSDGGRSWKLQHPGVDDIQSVDGPAFADLRNGWVLVNGDTVMHTTDGGGTWDAARLAPAGGRDIAAVPGSNARSAWVAGRWVTVEPGQAGARTTLMRTRDGGGHWQSRDAGIAPAALEAATRARLDGFLADARPRLEAVLAEILPGPCGFDGQEMIRLVMHNLGWDAARGWATPLTPSDFTYYTLPVNTHVVEADLDGDGHAEIAVDGTAQWVAESALLYAAVLHRDPAGGRWTTIWSEALTTESSADTRLRAEVASDGRPELWWEYMIPQDLVWSSSRDWSARLLRCEAGACRTVWREATGHEGRHCDVGGKYYGYEWSAAGVERSTYDGQPGIVVSSYGLALRDLTTDTESAGPPLLEAYHDGLVRDAYEWGLRTYVVRAQLIITPGHKLSLEPVTQSVDLTGDGERETVSFEWQADCTGLKETVTIYYRDASGSWRRGDTFAAIMSGYPGTGVFVHEGSGGAPASIDVCNAPSDPTPPEGPWPPLEPACSRYAFDAKAQRFVPIP